MNVLQAASVDGRVIGTVIQWNNHPETTLGWEPPVEISRECGQLGWTGDQCSAEGRYFTADYPGVLARTIAQRVGGETLYFVGALGDIVGPGSARCGRSTAPAPARQPVRPAARRRHPGRAELHLHRRQLPAGGHHRRAGGDRGAEDRRVRQMGHRPGPALAAPAVLLTAHEHRLQGAPRVDPETGYSSLGHAIPIAYRCPATGPKNDRTCVEGSATEEDPLAGTIRKGDHLKCGRRTWRSVRRSG